MLNSKIQQNLMEVPLEYLRKLAKMYHYLLNATIHSQIRIYDSHA